VSSITALAIALSIDAFLSRASFAARPKRGIAISFSAAFINWSEMNIWRQPTYHCGATPAFWLNSQNRAIELA